MHLYAINIDFYSFVETICFFDLWNNLINIIQTSFHRWLFKFCLELLHLVFLLAQFLLKNVFIWVLALISSHIYNDFFKVFCFGLFPTDLCFELLSQLFHRVKLKLKVAESFYKLHGFCVAVFFLGLIQIWQYFWRHICFDSSICIMLSLITKYFCLFLQRFIIPTDILVFFNQFVFQASHLSFLLAQFLSQSYFLLLIFRSCIYMLGALSFNGLW